jgi:hypothetical protein
MRPKLRSTGVTPGVPRRNGRTVDVDPLASMRCWAITVELGGREFDIPALPAVDWWPVLVSGEISRILDLLTPADTDQSADLDEMILDGTVSRADLSEAVSDAVEEATGRSFHVAFVLATVATSAWPMVGGQMAREGFRWDVQPIGAALDVIHNIVVGSLEKDNREKFLTMLENETVSMPGKKRTPSQRVVDEFEAMAGPRPAPAPLPGKASDGPSGSPRTRTRTRPRQPRQDGRSGAPKTQP